MSNSIEVTNLTKIFKTKALNKAGIKALDNVSLNVEKGIIFSLLGPNGAGKTTLIKILLGIVYPTVGNAKILDSDISNYEIRKNIGYLPENHKFPNYLNGEEVITYYSKLNGFDIDKNSPKISEVLNLVKMGKWRKTKIKKYSKGMMQRLGLAQAIIHNPEIIILDEPTDGIDPVGRKEIRDILKQLKSEGKTIFLNSHLLSEVELVSDKVAILNEGKLIKIGSVEELTVSKEICEIKVDQTLPNELTSKLGLEFKFKIVDYTVELEVEDNQVANKFMDELRKANINILGFNQKKNSLEDLFIKSITEKANNE